MNNRELNGGTNRRQASHFLRLLVLALAMLIVALVSNFVLFGHSSLAEKLSPDQIPPDVVLTPGSNKPAPAVQTDSSAKSTSTPGSKAGAMVPGLSTPPSYAGAGVPGTQNSQMGPVTPPANKKDPLAVLETSKGKIVIRLFQSMAPNTAANYIDLVNKGFYNGLTFHRVEPGFCVQGGCPNGDGTGSYVDPETNQPRNIKLEINARLRHNAPGVVAMAHTAADPNSNSSQFYITLSPQPALDMKYSIFGGVVEGMDVVRKIAIGDKIVSIKIEEQTN
jgi:peptidyl-prolyl cis-trans isomerase B (cyclophilin B)